MPTLYLFPVTLGDTEPQKVLPQSNIELMLTLTHFIVENVRTARRFMRACSRSVDIDSLHFAELNEHTSSADIPALLEPMTQGHDMGLLSEAGCPAVADPGADVVAIAQQRGYRVVPLVGPSSILMGLMASGFNGQTFAFQGYLPVKADARAARLREMTQRIRREHQTQIFIEAPYRNNRLIAELAQTLPPSLRLCVASGITTPAERITTLPVKQWATRTLDYDKVPAIFLLYE